MLFFLTLVANHALAVSTGRGFRSLDRTFMSDVGTRDHNKSSSVWNVQNFQNLVTFGDSYTDESRLAYFIAHNGSAPPAGYLLPEGLDTASGGRTWPRYVVQYTGHDSDNEPGCWEPQMTLYDYAVSGAVCSNEITPRYLSAISADFPSVLEYEIPAFEADTKTTRNETAEPFFTPARTATNTVYALWIGTNDMGVDCFLTDSQVRGKTLTDYTSCIYSVFDSLYAAGARALVLMNTIPLELTPLYANYTLNGSPASDNTYWPDKPSNYTAIAEQIREYTTSVNTIMHFQTAFETLATRRYAGASIALFDVHSLIAEIYTHPTKYLNGTEPVSVQSFENECVNAANGTQTCTLRYNGTSPDSFMWFDPLHPSTQTDRVIAREFIRVIDGKSHYATYF